MKTLLILILSIFASCTYPYKEPYRSFKITIYSYGRIIRQDTAIREPSFNGYLNTLTYVNKRNDTVEVKSDYLIEPIK